MTKSALLVIDIQVAAFETQGTPALHKAEDLLERSSRLIGAARSVGTPVVYVQHCAPAGQPFAKGTKGWAIHPAVTPQPSDPVVFKRESSAFEGTNLQELLERLGVDRLIACGLQSEYCVANTCIAALEQGWDVYVARDAHSTFSTEDEEAGSIINRQNSLLAKRGAKVQTTASLVQSLIEF